MFVWTLSKKVFIRIIVRTLFISIYNRKCDIINKTDSEQWGFQMIQAYSNLERDLLIILYYGLGNYPVTA